MKTTKEIELLPSELEKAFEKNDKKSIEAIIDFYHYDYYNSYDKNNDDEFDKYYEDRFKMVEVIYKRIKLKEEINDSFFIKYDEINEDLLSIIVQSFQEKLLRNFDEEFLFKKSAGEQSESNEELIDYIVTTYAESIFYSNYYDRAGIEFINKHNMEFIEERLEELGQLILNVYELGKNKEGSEKVDGIPEFGGLKKFRGNPLKKRKNEKVNKYTKIAQLIKIANEHYPQIRFTQKTACEMVGCNEFSFARWKNYKNNFDLFLKWQNELNQEEIRTIKTEIITYLKLHTDM